MKAYELAMSRILPKDVQQESYDLSKRGIGDLMARVASKHPDRFGEIAQKIGDLGRNAAWHQGYTTGGEDTKQVINTQKYYDQLDAELAHLKKQKLSPNEFDAQRAEIMTKYSDLISKATMLAATKNRNAFALAANSGARGNAGHISSILSTPGVYTDAKDRIIPIFVRNSFGDGVRPAETLAATYGARKAVVSTKTATARGGDILKIMTQNTLNFNVTEKDCEVKNGIAIPPTRDDLLGRVLARGAGGFKAGTVIDRKALAQIKKDGDPVVARSAMTCRARHGTCAKCLGVQADGKFYNVGESAGVTASAAIGEPIVQGSLNVKHNAGQAKGKQSFSGLDYISQFLQIPEEFKDRAAVSEVDGVVEDVREAAQGGKIIVVNGKEHFVAPGFEERVKVGQKVEAGDVISEGLANPADIVRLRGLGEGRKYYSERLSQMLSDSGQAPDPRNVELLTRAALDTYRAEDPDVDTPWNPDDSVRESDLLHNFKPDKDTRMLPVEGASNKYLQTPVLHYTVGTRITPTMAQDMRRNGVSRIPVSPNEPWFKPDMKRIRVAAHGDRDWLASMGTSYLSSQLRDSIERADDTNVKENYHYGPRLAFGGDLGSGGFGENTARTGKF